MLKKLQNLLFEEDEDFEDEEEEEEIVPIRPQRKTEPVQARPVTVTPKPVMEKQEVIVEKPKQTMQRIDLTQPVEKIQVRQTETAVKPKPVQEVSTPSASLFVDDTPAPVTPKPKKLGITVDDAPVTSKKTETKPVRQAQTRPSITPKSTRKEPVRNDSGYIFKPVISPIFGVDEKDLHALKTTTSKINEVEKQKTNGVRPQIISPIYGAEADNSTSASKTVVEPTVVRESTVVTPRSTMEDTIPEFSLDDILKAKDEDDKKESIRKAAGRKASSMPAFPDLDFDVDEDEKTILIKRSDVK